MANLTYDLLNGHLIRRHIAWLIAQSRLHLQYSKVWQWAEGKCVCNLHCALVWQFHSRETLEERRSLEWPFWGQWRDQRLHCLFWHHCYCLSKVRSQLIIRVRTQGSPSWDWFRANDALCCTSACQVNFGLLEALRKYAEAPRGKSWPFVATM